MKRISQYKKLFNIEGAIDLKELKKAYRDLVKQWHPDKFQDDDARKEEAQLMSREIIDGYHFLVSIAPETKEANLEEYKSLTNDSGILDFQHKGMVLEITFLDGTVYEYFGVSKQLYQKMVNSDKYYRFAKRNIFDSFLYRKAKKDNVEAASS